MKATKLLFLVMAMFLASGVKAQWNHQGWYLCMWDLLRGSVDKYQISFYNDRIEVHNKYSLEKGIAPSTYLYSGMQNGWKVYSRQDDYGFAKVLHVYYVNSNYDVKYISGGEEHPIVKDGESLGSYVRFSNSSGGGFSSGTTERRDTKTQQPQQPQQRTKCPNCTNGRRVYEKTNGSVPGGLGSRNMKRCSECGITYNANNITHFHDRCTTCHGKGYLD